jgi:outer membrane receptor protein involved in Fe transport
MRTKAKLMLASATLAVSAVVASPAVAQDSGEVQPPVPAENGGTEANGQTFSGVPDIIVTARKLEERLQDAPVAVSVVGAEQINELGLTSLDDFARQTTGLSFSQAFGRSTDRPVIRGQSNVLAGVQAGVETGAAFFIDGVYYQGDIQGFDPQAIERVEVIKGPQSALYGRNTYAGAINYVTKDPSRDFTVSGRARAAEHDEYELAGSVSGPLLGEAVGFRAGARFFTYGGEYTNQLTGKKVGEEKTRSAYLTLLVKPNDNLTIRPRIYWQKDDDGPLAIFLQGAALNNCKPGFRSPAFRAASPFLPGAPARLKSENNNQYYCGVIQAQPNNVRLNTDPIDLGAPFGVRDGTAFDGVENEQINITNVLDWDIGGSGWILSSLTGWRDNENYFGTDSDHSDAFAYFGPIPPAPAEPAFANTNRDDQRDFSQELRISSPSNQPLRGTFGIYYFKQKFQSVDITFGSGKAGLPLGTDLSQYATIENKALFGLLSWDVTDALNVTGELRYAEETKTLIDRSAGAASIFCAGQEGRLAQFGATAATPACRSKAEFKGTDPRITVNYTIPGGTLLYAVFATGRKPGGFNGAAGVTATLQTGQDFIQYAPEKSKGGELGVKFDALGRRLRGSAAAFYNELTNVQLTSAIPNPNGTGAITSIVTNSGDAETKGFEVELQAAPAQGLDMRLGIAYVDAKFTNGCDADEFILNSGGLRPNFDTRAPSPAALALCSIKGRRLPLGSPWIINGGISYEHEISPGSGLAAFANSSFSYEDSKYVQVHNLAETGDTFILDARIGVRTERFSIALFGRNLTDEDSIPLATRWFDIRYGAGTRGLPPAASVQFDGRPAQIETGSPRGFFATLRKGRTFGIEGTFRF